MTHEEKRRYLIQYLLDEGGYAQTIPSDEPSQRQLLRALMNVREAKPIDDAFLRIQDEYLQENVRRKGIVDADDLTPLRDGLRVWRGDITRLKADAIVNAANSGMTGCWYPNHNCIDNCIHTYAGVQLRLKCAALMAAQGAPEPTGQAKITPAYNLPSRFVIHTVGTICERGIVTPKNIRELKGCYRACMDIAEANGLKSIAFCCISTGVFGFPQKRGAEIAVETVGECMARCVHIERVVFNVFKPEDESFYIELLK